MRARARRERPPVGAVVDDQKMVVQAAPVPVRVRDHEDGNSGVKLLREELPREVARPHVIRISSVELVRGEGLDDAQGLYLSPL